MDKILVVDDIALNCAMLEEMLGDEYEVVTAENGRIAMQILEDHYQEFAVVLLDLIMPDVDGFAVLERMKERDWLATLPVIVISGEDSKDAEKRSMMLGASDYIRKPFDEFLVKRRVKNTADLYLYKKSLERKVQNQTNELHEQYLLLQEQAEKIRQTNERVVDILGTVVEYRNLESGEHIQRVKGFTRILAKELSAERPEYGLTQENIKEIVSASALHDIGKIAIPDHILLKPGRLTAEEFEIMKTHTAKGGEIIQQIEGVWDARNKKICYEICRHHHERYDGRGYPDGLKGEEIPIAAQIVSLADVYDALVSERVYKKPFPLDKAFEMILAGECGAFSPKLLDCFKKVRGEFEALAKQNSQGSAAYHL